MHSNLCQALEKARICSNAPNKLRIREHMYSHKTALYAGSSSIALFEAINNRERLPRGFGASSKNHQKNKGSIRDSG